MNLTKPALIGLALACATLAHAEITYEVSIAGPLGSSLYGTITTDGTIGVIQNANIVSTNLSINDGQDPPTAGILNVLAGNDLDATASDLVFDYSASDGGAIQVQAVAAWYAVAGSPGHDQWYLTYDPCNACDTAPSPGGVIATAPEPASYALGLTGLGLLGVLRKRLVPTIR
jgi:hypothetical protein